MWETSARQRKSSPCSLAISRELYDQARPQVARLQSVEGPDPNQRKKSGSNKLELILCDGSGWGPIQQLIETTRGRRTLVMGLTEVAAHRGTITKDIDA